MVLSMFAGMRRSGTGRYCYVILDTMGNTMDVIEDESDWQVEKAGYAKKPCVNLEVTVQEFNEQIKHGEAIRKARA